MILETAIMCLALNVYYEARGEPTLGQFAVAAVTMKRADYEWKQICSVVYEPKQFSWTHQKKQGPPIKIAALNKAVYIATRTALSSPDDMEEILGEYVEATHFHADYVQPWWIEDMVFIGQIGRHLFYKEPL